jgi:phosphate transport system permease protein
MSARVDLSHREASSDRIDLEDLRRSLRRPRSLISFLLTATTTVLTLAALFPLFSVIYMLLIRGSRQLHWTTFLRSSQKLHGAFGNAVMGTVLIVAMAALISVPIGIMAAVFLTEIGPETRLASAVRFAAKTLSGYPSILAGVVTYGVLVVVIGVSAFSGAFALSLLMLPTIVLTAEEAIRMVPSRIREAAIGMGATRTQTILRVMLPTAMPGILTGVMLAVARAAGETAPLLFTASFNNNWPIGADGISLNEPTASLAVYIWRCSKVMADFEIGWAAALVLVVLVLIINLIGQGFSGRTTR